MIKKIDIINKWVNLLQSVFVILGVILTTLSVMGLVEQNKIQNDALKVQNSSLSVQNDTLKQTRLATSADLTLRLNDKFNSGTTGAILLEIENHPHDHPIINKKGEGSGGKYTYDDVEEYLGYFEDIALLYKDNLILSDMVQNDFSYDFEKSWCNDDIQNIIKTDRETEHVVGIDSFWTNFERLSKESLHLDNNKTCKDIDKE